VGRGGRGLIQCSQAPSAGFCGDDRESLGTRQKPLGWAGPNRQLIGLDVHGEGRSG
jgi:hypothetical protein